MAEEKKANKENTGLLVGAGALALAGVALVIFRGQVKDKEPGDTLKATYRFIHKGPGGTFEIGTGLAPSRTIGHNSIVYWLYHNEEVPPHLSPTQVEVNIEFRWPNLDPGKYDALAYIQIVGGQRDPGGDFYIIAKWKNDALIGR